jgi:hypothetical protein
MKNTYLQKKRSFAGIAALFLLLSLLIAPFAGQVQALAAPEPVNVTLRVEGASANLLHTSLEVLSVEGAPQTALDALKQGLDGAGITYTITSTDWGPYIQAIGGEEAGTFGGFDGWIFVVNNDTAPVGAADYLINAGEHLVFYYGMFPPDTLIPTVGISPANPQAGEEFTVTVSSTYFDWGLGGSVTVTIAGVLLTFNSQEYLTDANGQAVIQAPETAGTYNLKARKDVHASYPLMVRTGNIAVPVAEEVLVDKALLDAAIAEVEGLLAVAVAGESPGQYPQTALDALSETLEASQEVQLAESATQAQVDAATATLNKAIKDFKAAVIKEKVPGLEKAIADAISFYANKPSLTSWWELVALRGAGVDLTKGAWANKLPVWNNASLPADGPATSHATYILGLLARGEHPEKAWGSRNLVAELAAKQQQDGSFGDGINSTIWGIIALEACYYGYNADQAVAYLLNQQLPGGGFTFFGESGDPDMTAMALVALSRHKDQAGVNDAIEAALLFLESIQLDSAGFASWGSENANTIAAVITGLVSVGQDVFSERWIKNPSIYDALMAFQMQNGSFSFLSDPLQSNDIATSQALLALVDLNAGVPTFFYGLRTQPRVDGVLPWGMLFGSLAFLVGTALILKKKVHA